MAKYDDMSFGKAFAAARREKGKGKTFTWRGEPYSTNRADDAPSSGSSEDSFVARNRQAIDRAEAEKRATRPVARPANGGRTPAVRPVARPTDAVPVTRDASSPKVTPTAPEPQRSGRTSYPPTGPRPNRTSRPPTGPQPAPKPASESGRYTFSEWENMTPTQRREAGLPRSRLEARLTLRGGGSNSGNKASRRPGGSAARGYAKGGVVKANCGASMKPTQKGTKK